eukprot:8299564-Pyramimonas_sp.AAC.1
MSLLLGFSVGMSVDERFLMNDRLSCFAGRPLWVPELGYLLRPGCCLVEDHWLALDMYTASFPDEKREW